ncbi:hypothetical protein D3C86_1322170 [compost metagenome]
MANTWSGRWSSKYSMKAPRFFMEIIAPMPNSWRLASSPLPPNTSMGMIHSLMPLSVIRRSKRPSLPSSLLVVRATTVTGLAIHSSVMGRSVLSSSVPSSAAVRIKPCQYTPGFSLRLFSFVTQCSYTPQQGRSGATFGVSHIRNLAETFAAWLAVIFAVLAPSVAPAVPPRSVVRWVTLLVGMVGAPAVQIVEVGQGVGRTARPVRKRY